MTASIPSRGTVTRDRWGPARNLFVQYAEKFVNATRYEEASAIADQAAREIEDLFPAEAAGCFECCAPLVGPFCPKCNPAIKQALGLPVEAGGSTQIGEG